MEVEVQPEELNGHDEQSSEQLVIMEGESPQLLLALSKRRSVVTGSSEEVTITPLHNIRSEGSAVPVE